LERFHDIIVVDLILIMKDILGVTTKQINYVSAAYSHESPARSDYS